MKFLSVLFLGGGFSMSVGAFAETVHTFNCSYSVATLTTNQKLVDHKSFTVQTNAKVGHGSALQVWQVPEREMSLSFTVMTEGNGSYAPTLGIDASLDGAVQEIAFSLPPAAPLASFNLSVGTMLKDVVCDVQCVLVP